MLILCDLSKISMNDLLRLKEYKRLNVKNSSKNLICIKFFFVLHRSIVEKICFDIFDFIALAGGSVSKSSGIKNLVKM